MSFEVGDRQRLRALSHPLRLRILSNLAYSPKSGTELARELDLSQAAVSYHVRALASAGLIEVAETRNVRGGREKRYRLTPVASGTGSSRDLVENTSAVSAELQRRLSELRPESWDVFSDAELWVDPELWTSCAKQVAALLIELQAAAGPPHADGLMHVSATAILFREGQVQTPAQGTARQ